MTGNIALTYSDAIVGKYEDSTSLSVRVIASIIVQKGLALLTVLDRESS